MRFMLKSKNKLFVWGKNSRCILSTSCTWFYMVCKCILFMDTFTTKHKKITDFFTFFSKCRYVVHPIWETEALRLLITGCRDPVLSAVCVCVCVCDGTDLAFDWCADSDVKLLEHIFGTWVKGHCCDLASRIPVCVSVCAGDSFILLNSAVTWL